MTQQNNEAFEKWYINERGYKKSELELNERGEYKLLEARIDYPVWQAATKHSESILQEQQNTIAELKADLESEHKWASDYAKQTLELQASNNKLRETLLTTQDALSQLVHHGMEQWAKDRANDAYEYIEKCISSTPAQSLQAHDDEVIERCASDLDRQGFNHAADAIRALKGTS